MRECKLCGKIETSNFVKHFKTNHEGQPITAVKEGEFADTYYWSGGKRRVNKDLC